MSLPAATKQLRQFAVNSKTMYFWYRIKIIYLSFLQKFLKYSPVAFVFVNFSEVVDIDIEDNGDGKVKIYYQVADAGDYTLSIKFGGQPIPDGFYTFTVSV